ncbi:MAG: nitroreductase family deazaflavin-dependent oxidoreductase [Chloroflexi bacterium SZAS-1]|jgi:deazaflavin-dependent oxidoreductase (nitroreductase family)|nr:nitroreductase family deazaflavin-dependent oxidoreductase [Chloroflexi bacterium SZAS-1]HNP88099.1 nitroreductase family deazaflavin-dependent oxidoreductase [Kouleothrix sp.]
MVFKLVLWLHVTLYRLTGGRLGGRNIILLTTTGKKSGQSRTRPLFHMKDRGDYIVIASAGGSAKNPAWYANLTANPRVTVEDHGRTFSGVASTVNPEERARLWQQVVATNSGFAGYEQRTSRVIPIVRIQTH